MGCWAPHLSEKQGTKALVGKDCKHVMCQRLRKGGRGQAGVLWAASMSDAAGWDEGVGVGGSGGFQLTEKPVHITMQAIKAISRATYWQQRVAKQQTPTRLLSHYQVPYQTSSSKSRINVNATILELFVHGGVSGE